MKKIRLALFASGSGSNARRIMEYFADHERIEIGLLLSNKKDAGALQHAVACGVAHRYLHSREFKEGHEVLHILQGHGIDRIVLAGFLLLVPEVVISFYANKIVNIHPALLPKYGGKGMYGHFVHEAVAAAGEIESGITIHLVNEHFDEGRILEQHHTPLLPSDGPSEIEAKVRALELLFFAPAIETWLIHA
jgi:phosphoribosylglycinamide formyltransferase 1